MSTMKSVHSAYTYCIIKLLYLASNLLKLGCGSLKMLRDHVSYSHISASSCCREHKSSSLDLIRNNGIFGTVKLLHTFDTDHICTCTLNIGTHAIQEIGNVYNVRLSGCILNNRAAWCQGCCHHNVNRRSNGNHIKENMAAMKICCLCNNCAVKNIHLGTKGSESFQMLVDWTASNIASAWKRNFRSFIFAKHSTKKIV